jgi:hypothetical protein
MNHTGTPVRTALRAGLVVDITDEALERRAAHRSAHRLDSDVVRALMFAQGLDERGKRLPLASDSMTEEERYPHHVVAERQGLRRRPAECIGSQKRSMTGYQMSQPFVRSPIKSGWQPQTKHR